MNKLMTIGSLAVAGIFTAGLVATQAPTAFAHDSSPQGGDDSSAVVRTVDDHRGRDHAEDGRHHHRHGHDDHGRHHGHNRHGHDDRGRHGGDDRR